jgi:hypothetical protein
MFKVYQQAFFFIYIYILFDANRWNYDRILKYMQKSHVNFVNEGKTR